MPSNSNSILRVQFWSTTTRSIFEENKSRRFSQLKDALTTFTFLQNKLFSEQIVFQSNKNVHYQSTKDHFPHKCEVIFQTLRLQKYNVFESGSTFVTFLVSILLNNFLHVSKLFHCILLYRNCSLIASKLLYFFI